MCKDLMINFSAIILTNNCSEVNYIYVILRKFRDFLFLVRRSTTSTKVSFYALEELKRLKASKVSAAIFCLYRHRRVTGAKERGCLGGRAHGKCTRVCKHFKLVFRCAAVDCSTAARFRGLLRLRLIVRRQMPSSSSPLPPSRPPFTTFFHLPALFYETSSPFSFGRLATLVHF